jgi:uncharacterized protein
MERESAGGEVRSIPADDALAMAVLAAIRRGDVETLQRRLDENPDLAAARFIDRHGVSRTLLHAVADWPGHLPNGSMMVAILAAAGTDVDAPVLHVGPKGSAETPLHWAASNDDVGVLDALLDAGADIEAPGAVFTGGTPMSDAVVFAQWRAARRLVERGATTTLWQAAALGLLGRLRELCSIVPPPTTEEITNAFWNACRGGRQPAAEYLLDRGADRNWVGHDGKTPWDVALESGDDDLIQWLLARGGQQAPELK